MSEQYSQSSSGQESKGGKRKVKREGMRWVNTGQERQKG